MFKPASLIMGLAFLVISSSCSGNTTKITTPDLNSDLDSTSFVLVSERAPDGSPLEGYGFMGLYSVSLNPISLQGEMAPLRASSLEDVLEVVDITNFLQLAPCTDCAKINSVAIDADGHLVVSVGIKHPFGVGDPYKPITGKNRADLHVFNVEGIVVSDGLGAKNFPAIGASIGDLGLINADGFTKYLDSSLDQILPTVANAHPYRLHFDDFSDGNYSASNQMGFESVTTPAPSGHLVMSMGCDYSYKDYVFDIQNAGTFNFIYAIGCTYAVSSANKSMRFTPEYRLPQHNKKAATSVQVEILTNDLKDGDTSSTAQIEIKVVDVNHGIPVGTALNEMRADSSVDDIFIDIPGVLSSFVVLDGNNPVSGTGLNPSEPLVYQGTITNSAGGAEGSYVGLVKVSDSYAPNLNTSPLLSGSDGITRVDPLLNPLTGTFDIDEFSTYQTFTIDVATGYIPQLVLVYDETIDPDLGNNPQGLDMDNADELGPCLNWESDGEYCLNFAVQYEPFNDPWNGHRMTAVVFMDENFNITQSTNPWWGGVGWRNWNKSYMSSRINATYASLHEVDGLQHPLGIMDHAVITAWGGGLAYMDHSSEIFVSRISGRCFILGDHSAVIRYAISTAQDTLPFDLYASGNYWASTIPGPAYISEAHSMEDDSTGKIYLAYFDGPAMSKIKLARSTDLEVGHSWINTDLYSGGTEASEVRDPGIHVYSDDSVHIAFSRKINATGTYELVYMSSENGGDTFTSPLVVATSPNPMYETPIKVFEDPSLPGYEFVIMVYESGGIVYLNWSSDKGATWQTLLVQVSETGVVSHDPYLEINTMDHRINVAFVADHPITFGDIKIANYHFEII